MLYTAFTPCLRTERGCYGRASRGAFRVHQFHKVEQIVFCRPEDSEKVVGDMGAPGCKEFDLEAWFAGFGRYRETHSNTNLLDYQPRRLGTRCKDARGEGAETFHPHTISATVITDRALLAILENNQQAGGSVVVPKALCQFLNGRERIRPAN